MLRSVAIVESCVCVVEFCYLTLSDLRAIGIRMQVAGRVSLNFDPTNARPTLPSA